MGGESSFGIAINVSQVLGAVVAGGVLYLIVSVGIFFLETIAAE